MNLLRSFAVVLAAFSVATTANQLCPGASSASYGNGQLACTQPVCLVSGGGLRPSSDPTKFFVCAGPGINYEMSCAPQTCFSYSKQTCVHPNDWTDICQRHQASETTTITTEEPTTTTQEPSTTTKASAEPIRNVKICPDSDPSAMTYGTQDCAPIDCSSELSLSQKLLPSKDPLYFYSCFKGNTLRQERCPTGTCFDYGRQSCVGPSVWQNYCSGL